MPHDPAPSSAAQTIIADPEGDIILVVGRQNSDQKSIRVSSKVLSLASPAFAALFSPRWSEGTDKSSSVHPREIDLPDDDTAAMGWICQALHFRKNIPTNIGLLHLEMVAVVCDKYDLDAALKPWGQTWLQSLRWPIRGELQEAESVSLMWVSLFFDNSRLFWYSSWILQFCHPRRSSFLEGHHISGIAASFLKEKTLESIIADRQDIILDVHTMLEDMMIPLLSDTEGAITFTHHVQELKRIDLWPLSQKLEHASIMSVEAKLRLYQVCKRDNCGCVRGEMHDAIQAILNYTLEKQDGLCLTCYKVGKISRSSGNCMMLQQTLCPSGEVEDPRFRSIRILSALEQRPD